MYVRTYATLPSVTGHVLAVLVRERVQPQPHGHQDPHDRVGLAAGEDVERRGHGDGEEHEDQTAPHGAKAAPTWELLLSSVAVD